MRIAFITILIGFSISTRASDIGLEYELGKNALKENQIDKAKEHFFKCFEIIDSAQTFKRRINCFAVEYSYGDLNPEIFNKIYFWMAVCFKSEDKPFHSAIMLQIAENYEKKYNWTCAKSESYNNESKILRKWIKKKGENPYPNIELPEGNNIIQLIQTNEFDEALGDDKTIRKKEKYVIEIFDDKLN
jgi:hypothetical protein